MQFQLCAIPFQNEGVSEIDRLIVSTEDKEANCTVDVSLEDFNAMLSGDLNPMGAFMAGKMKVKGDPSVAMKLQSLFA